MITAKELTDENEADKEMKDLLKETSINEADFLKRMDSVHKINFLN